jgi:hypothetical protein
MARIAAPVSPVLASVLSLRRHNSRCLAYILFAASSYVIPRFRDCSALNSWITNVCFLRLLTGAGRGGGGICRANSRIILQAKSAPRTFSMSLMASLRRPVAHAAACSYAHPYTGSGASGHSTAGRIVSSVGDRNLNRDGFGGPDGLKGGTIAPPVGDGVTGFCSE